MAGILSGPSILNAVMNGEISITPFDSNQINPVSYDLRLGNKVAVYRQWAKCISGPNEHDCHARKCIQDGSNIRAKTPEWPNFQDNTMDCKQTAELMQWDMDPEIGWVLHPGVAYLMHTHERISTNTYVPILDGKSSIGRLFLQVHATAGFGDPGFDGQYTLEVTVTNPLRVYPGMRICQIRFHTIDGEVRNYQDVGSYRGKLAEGPIASQAWKMYQDGKWK